LIDAEFDRLGVPKAAPKYGSRSCAERSLEIVSD
jgi:hypothetical protein